MMQREEQMAGQVGQQAGKSLGPNKFTFNDELVNAWTGVGTQLNGSGHIGIDNVYYDGNKAADFVTVDGVTAWASAGCRVSGSLHC